MRRLAQATRWKARQRERETKKESEKSKMRKEIEGETRRLSARTRFEVSRGECDAIYVASAHAGWSDSVELSPRASAFS